MFSISLRMYIVLVSFIRVKYQFLDTLTVFTIKISVYNGTIFQ